MLFKITLLIIMGFTHPALLCSSIHYRRFQNLYLTSPCAVLIDSIPCPSETNRHSCALGVNPISSWYWSKELIFSSSLNHWTSCYLLVSSGATAILICPLLQSNRIQGEEREEAEGPRTRDSRQWLGSLEEWKMFLKLHKPGSPQALLP